MEECKQEPNWTELLEKEYRDDLSSWRIVEHLRSQGRTDEVIYQLLDSFG